jgi:flagellar biosynthesis protein FlhA
VLSIAELPAAQPIEVVAVIGGAPAPGLPQPSPPPQPESMVA